MKSRLLLAAVVTFMLAGVLLVSGCGRRPSLNAPPSVLGPSPTGQPAAPAAEPKEWVELIKNGSVEEASTLKKGAPANWEYEAGRIYAWDSTQAHSGKRSVKCATLSFGGTQAALQRIELAKPSLGPFMLSAWSKAEGPVTGSPNADYSVYADFVYDDDSVLYATRVPFDVGTHNWQERQLRVNPAKPVKMINFWVQFRKTHVGTVWFDDMSLKQAKY